MTDSLRFKDFSLAPEAPTMRIAPDEFHLYPEIPLDVMMDIAELSQKQVSGTERMEQMMQLLSGVIDAQDWDKFIARTKRGTADAPNPNPIGIRHVKEILPWIMEVYGLRPTQESSSSADGSDDASTSSTELASGEG